MLCLSFNEVNSPMIEDARQHLVKTWLLNAVNIEAIKTRNKEEVEEEIVNFAGKIVK